MDIIAQEELQRKKAALEKLRGLVHETSPLAGMLVDWVGSDKQNAPGDDSIHQSAVQADDILPVAKAPILAAKGAGMAAKGMGMAAPLLMGGLKKVAEKGEQMGIRELGEAALKKLAGGAEQNIAKKAELLVVPKELPLDVASREMRALEQGYSPEVYYRGIAGEYAPSNAPQYFTKNPKFASGYAEGNAPFPKEAKALMDQSDNIYDLRATISNGMPKDPYGVKALEHLSPRQIEEVQKHLGKEIPKKWDLLDVENALTKREDQLKKASKSATKAGAGETANVLPVRLRMENPYTHDFEGKPFNVSTQDDIIEKAKELGHDSVIFKNMKDWTPGDKMMHTGDQVVTFDPSQIRSKFAKFDPAKIKSSDISAGIGAVASYPALKALMEKRQSSENEF